VACPKLANQVDVEVEVVAVTVEGVIDLGQHRVGEDRIGHATA